MGRCGAPSRKRRRMEDELCQMPQRGWGIGIGKHYANEEAFLADLAAWYVERDALNAQAEIHADDTQQAFLSAASNNLFAYDNDTLTFACSFFGTCLCIDLRCAQAHQTSGPRCDRLECPPEDRCARFCGDWDDASLPESTSSTQPPAVSTTTEACYETLSTCVPSQPAQARNECPDGQTATSTRPGFNSSMSGDPSCE